MFGLEVSEWVCVGGGGVVKFFVLCLGCFWWELEGVVCGWNLGLIDGWRDVCLGWEGEFLGGLDYIFWVSGF